MASDILQDLKPGSRIGYATAWMPFLHHGEVRMLLAIINRIDSDSGECYNSIDGWARDCGLRRGGARSAIAGLLAKGVISSKGAGGTFVDENGQRRGKANRLSLTGNTPPIPAAGTTPKPAAPATPSLVEPAARSSEPAANGSIPVARTLVPAAPAAPNRYFLTGPSNRPEEPRRGGGSTTEQPPRRTYPWIRTAARDPARQADNEAALQALENKYGPPLVARAAETVALRKGGKLYPDDKDLLAELYRISDEGWPKPEVDPRELAYLTKAEIARHEARQAERRAKGLPTTELAIVRFTDPPDGGS